MVDSALTAAMYSLYKSDFEQAKCQAELNKALKHLRRAGINEIKFTLSNEQLRQIDAARSRGDNINITINFS